MFGVPRFGEDLAKGCDQNFSLAARFGVTNFTFQGFVCQVLNFLRGTFIEVRIAAILTHTRRDVGDEQDGVAVFNRQHPSDFLKAIMFAD